jgi:hypothetical protein
VAPLIELLRLTPATATLAFWLATLAALEWQWIRTPSHAQQTVRARAFAMTSEFDSAFEFCRDSLPESSVVFTNLQGTNLALWSGFGGRRSYLDYIPVGAAVDPLLPAAHSVQARWSVIQNAYGSESAAEVAQLLAASGATHLVESAAEPLHAYPSTLRRIWQSPQRTLSVWEIRR